MVGSLSPALRQLLLDLQLCTPNDLRRCRSIVKRLADDLPAFDSVWLDALLQMGRLTPFQVRRLESSEPENLRRGEYALIELVSESRHETQYLAEPIASVRPGRRALSDLRWLQEWSQLEHIAPGATQRLRKLVESAGEVSHPRLHLVSELVESGDTVVLVAQATNGPRLSDLLARRGRFDPQVVWSIGRQLVDALAYLHAHGNVHGDVRLENIQLTARGDVVLSQIGIRPAIEPRISHLSDFTPHWYEGTAPELQQAGQPYTAATDVYALGCTLWQLLAGRPPFPGLNAVTKLGYHQTRDIPDVRDWAPDTPRELAEVLFLCTRRDPHRRPAWDDISHAWGRPTAATVKHLAQFSRHFSLPVSGALLRRPTADIPATGWVAALLFAVSGIVVATMSPTDPAWTVSIPQSWHEVSDRAQGWRNRALAFVSTSRSTVPGKAAPSVASASATPRAETRDRTGGLGDALPAANAQGVIELVGGQRYRPTRLAAVGPLVIQCTDKTPAEILIDQTEWDVQAESLRIDNVIVRRLPAPIHHDAARGASPGRTSSQDPTPVDRKPRALLLATAREVILDRVTFRDEAAAWVVASLRDAESRRDGKPHESVRRTANPPPSDPASRSPIAVAWKTLGPGGPAGRLSVNRCQFYGDGTAVYVVSAHTETVVSQTLKVGRGTFLYLADVPAKPLPVTVRLKQVTCRAADHLLRWVWPADRRPRGPLDIEATDCVVDVAEGGAVVHLVGGDLPRNWPATVAVSGEGSMVSANGRFAAWSRAGTGDSEELDVSLMRIEGITAGPFEFAGPVSVQPADAAIVRFDAPRRAPHPPGADPLQLLPRN